MVANFRDPRLPEGRNLRQVPIVLKGNILRRVLVGITRPKKFMGMGWVGFDSKFHGYFRVGYPKRLIILGSFGYQTHG